MLDDLQIAARSALSGGPSANPELVQVFTRPSAGVIEIVTALAGRSFGAGQLRVLQVDEVAPTLTRCVDLVGQGAAAFRPFAEDWLARAWGYDSTTGDVSVVEPHSGDLLSLEMTVAEVVLDDEFDEFLEGDLWRAWIADHPVPVSGRCVGLEIPLFLGGDLVMSNLSEQDHDVYWTICTQLRWGAARLRPGERVSQVRLE